VYGTRVNVPEYMVTAAGTYRLLTDHLGSVRVVVDVTSGNIVQEREYDEWGRMDTEYDEFESTELGELQPFGFAGGLYDPLTELVRFGARDYDAYAGRWTAKDPMGLDRMHPNLFGYVLNVPTSLVDPLGLWYIDANASGGSILGATGGVMINGDGVFPYVGPGLTTPGGSWAITYSPSDPSPGLNVGLQGQAGIAAQYGYAFGNGDFWELGVGWPPGAGLWGYWVFNPWRWASSEAAKPCKD
jgi:RHS repeat-associated protein